MKGTQQINTADDFTSANTITVPGDVYVVG